GRCDIDGTRHMTAAQAGPWLRVAAGGTSGPPGVAELRAAAIDCHLYVALHRHGACVHLGVKLAGDAHHGTRFGLSPSSSPGGQAAIEDEYVFGAKNAERPPHAWRGKKAESIIDDDRVGLADAESAPRCAD